MTKLKLALMMSRLHQYEIADLAGISETRLCRLALGRGAPTDSERHRLAQVLGAPVDSLFEEVK